MNSRVGIDMFEDMHKSQDGQEELLIFGYSCKLFRDDEKALYIENGEHLIPWMGNNDLMIDRFDVRGTLYDLSGAESKGQGGLTEAELKTEELCDQERYFALYYDETQFQLMQEEECKRLQAEISNGDGGYNQIGYSYNESSQPIISTTTTNDDANPSEPPELITYNPSQEEEIFFPTPEMNIPPGMEVPNTVKQHKIILKTARFVASHGAQMEILIKTKQAGNSLFNFLSFDNGLNVFYKHIIGLVKCGKLKPEEESNTSSSDQNDQQLHSNLPATRPDLTPGVSAAVSQPSPNCPYSKLTSKIKESQRVPSTEESELSNTTETQKNQANNQNTSAGAPKKNAAVPGSVQSRGISSALVGLVDYPSSSFNQVACDYTDEEDAAEHSHSPVKNKDPPPVVRDYSSIPWPPPEMQMVIDKMACYIIKNGHEFEEVVKSRRDPRMQFLESNHMYNEYFKCKIQLYSEVYGDLFKNPTKLQEWIKKCQLSHDKQLKSKSNGIKGISFSIKSREQEAAVTNRTSFPIESSTSEEEENMEEEEKEQRRVAREKRRAERRQKQEKEKKEREEFLRKERLRKEQELLQKRQRRGTFAAIDESSSGNEDLYDIFKYAQEMNNDKCEKKVLDKSTKVLHKPKLDAKKTNLAASELKEGAAVPIGPQLPPDMALELSLNYPSSSSSSSSSSPSRSSTEKNSTRQSPTTRSAPSSPSSHSADAADTKIDDEDEAEESTKVFDEEDNPDEKNTLSRPGDDSTVAIILSDQEEGEIGASVEESSRSARSGHRKKRRRSSISGGASNRKRSKKKKSHGEHKRKRRRSSSGQHRSKSHRSSRKKKHSSHRDKEKSRKKRKRRRSPSVSSLPSSDSSDSSTPTSLPSESDSDMDIQVIDLEEGKGNETESGIECLKTASSDRTTTTVNEKPTVRKELLDEKSTQLSSLLLGQQRRKLATRSLGTTPPPEKAASESENVSSNFDPNKSTAMAKIAQGLRAKLNALLEKESKIE